MAKRGRNQIRVGAGRTNVAAKLMPLFLMGIIGLALFDVAAAMLLTLGMIPTVVIVFTGTGIYAGLKAQTVAFANLGGVMAALAGPSQQAHNAPLFDIYGLSLAYAGAALGYILVFLGPVLAAVILQGFSQERVRQLTKQRQTMIDQWGGEILSGPVENKPEPGPPGP